MEPFISPKISMATRTTIEKWCCHTLFWDRSRAVFNSCAVCLFSDSRGHGFVEGNMFTGFLIISLDLLKGKCSPETMVCPITNTPFRFQFAEIHWLAKDIVIVGKTLESSQHIHGKTLESWHHDIMTHHDLGIPFRTWWPRVPRPTMVGAPCPWAVPRAE